MVKKTKHTPGPWYLPGQLDEKLDFIDRQVYDKNSHTIAQCEHTKILSSDYREFSRDEQRANARLIAAAPEMAEQLETCLAMLEATVCGGPVPISPKWEKLGPEKTFRYIRAILVKAGVSDGGTG